MTDADLKPATSAEDIVIQLTEAVHEHRVLPGMKLGEDEVGDIFGVGRTVVRQALSLIHISEPTRPY